VLESLEASLVTAFMASAVISVWWLFGAADKVQGKMLMASADRRGSIFFIPAYFRSECS